MTATDKAFAALSLQETQHNHFIKEMCHEEIPHRDRVDLAAYHPGSRECQRGPGFAVEPGIRRQRLLTSSRANEHLCSQARDDASQAAVWHTRDGRLRQR